MPGSFAEKPQGPGNFFFPKGQNAAFGVHRFNMVGSGVLGSLVVPPTGIPTGVGSGGVPEVTATYAGTGIYSIKFPPTREVEIAATVSSSSGVQYNAYVNNIAPVSGTAQLEITRNVFPSGLAAVTGFQGFPATGTRVSLQFFACPNSDGITDY